MARIDVSKIAGYADMTLEQKVAAMEAFEYEDNASELERYKNAASKANSEAAEWKKKHNLLLSDEERNKAERDEEFAKMKTELEGLRKEKTISSNKASLIALGYDENLANETASAMFAGDNAKVFANQKKFLEAREKALRSEILKQTPTPPPGDGNNPITKETFAKMGYEARVKLSADNPTLYNELTAD